MLQDSVFHINTPDAFKKKAFEVFCYQFEKNPVYRSYCDLLYKHPSDIEQLEEIPFLPISFFKTKKVLSSDSAVQVVFSSSGTTGSQTAKHYVVNSQVYQKSFRKAFQYFYGDINEYVVLALLPSYLERKGSSLVYMVHDMIVASKHPESGFYLNEYDLLAKKLKTLDSGGKKVLLIGVSFALLDLAEKYSFSLKNTIIMETGGMKGRRKELIRDELHAVLKKAFGVSAIHSEYGMTELLSQAYSKRDGLFYAPPWMKILTRDPEDPLSMVLGQTGGINIIDLANINSCSFIATQDLGKVYPTEGFEILGRFDHSDIRGCNLMVL